MPNLQHPVAVPRPSPEAGLFTRLAMAKKNLLSAWSDDDYRAPFFRFKVFRQQFVVCNSPETVRRVFLELHDNYDCKSPQMRHALEPLLGDGLFVSDGKLWKDRRKYCAAAFENELLPDYVETMVESAQELCAQWRDLSPDAEVDMLNEMARLTARIIGRSIFGDNTSDVEAARVVDGFTEYQRHVEQLEMADSIGMPFLRWFRNPIRGLRTRYAAKRVHGVIDGIIERYQKEGHDKKFSLISLLLDGNTGVVGKDRKNTLGLDAARNEAIVMFMAGHETTANSLAWAWYLLDKHPQAMAQIQKEVDSVLNGRSPTLQDVGELHFTRAVFEETLRLYPPVPLLSRQARGGDQINGFNVEKNAIVLVLPWLLHRHEELWDEPNAFKPERFLPDQPRPDKFAYIPFSMGHRVCLGKRFGLTEGIICLAILAQAFTPKLRRAHEVEIECRLTLRPKNGLPMTLQHRR